MSNTVADVYADCTDDPAAYGREAQVAVMSAGNGIAHSESSPVDDGAHGGRDVFLHGAQLWVALPESARHGEHSFVLHEPAPFRDSRGLRARVFVDRMGTTVAPAQGLTPLVGVELSPESLRRRAGSVPLDPAYEHLSA